MDRHYRLPDGSVAADSKTWAGPYCLRDRDMYFHLEDGIVARMSIGYLWTEDTDFFGLCAGPNRRDRQVFSVGVIR